MEDTIKINYGEVLNNLKNFFSQKKVQNIIVILLFLATLFVGAYIRLQPVINGNLIDQTTGDYTPLALDPYYFLRVSETIVANNGTLPGFDDMRYSVLEVPWTNELTPRATVLIYKIAQIFSPNVSLNLADVLNPVVFFVLGLIIFFILSWVLSKNRWVALVASILLSIVPPYLYRTLAGFADHEAIGMFGFFLSLLFFYLGTIYVSKKNSTSLKSGSIGLITGLFTMFAIASWGGGAKFLFMILPLAFLINWVLKEKNSSWKGVSFYVAFIFGTLIFSFLFGDNPFSVLRGYMVSSFGILTLITLGYIISEKIISTFNKIPKTVKTHKEFFSVLFLFLFGGFLYQLFIGNFFQMIFDLITKVIYPFGTGRVGLTVAENRQPYLSNWISQIGQTIFYLMLFGLAVVGAKISKGIKNKKLKPLFFGSFLFFVFGILFSRISPGSIFNGENFISKAFFFISFLAIVTISIYVYKKSEWKIDTKWIFIASWMLPMILAVRSAVRVFFAIVPFVSFIVPLALLELGKFAKRSKDDLMKFISFILLIILIIGLIFSLNGFYKTVSSQAKYQTPSYNSDWQKAMSWVRNNTAEGSLFLHWWDYGYWVQTGGKRPTVTDGGHFNGYWDHLIGRYVLTTPYPETAKSFMKAHNVSYLLIDPTDIGKYGAYSSIGDNQNISDRASYLPTFLSNPKETQETKNGTTRIYRGGFALDSDLILNREGNKKLFLPRGKTGLLAFIIGKSSRAYSQPVGVYVYNNRQYKVPIRYLYTQDMGLIDFKRGINATIYVYPSVQNQRLNFNGAAMYLSEKTMDSLVVQLYLMKDPKNLYPELKLVKEQGVYPLNFYYNGFRGPIRIWEVNTSAMTDIIAREEFLKKSGEYGGLDGLQFKN